MTNAKSITFNILPTGCHECTSHARNKYGYPIITRKGKQTTVVRFLYKEKHGDISNELVTRHICDNPACINLSHILVGSHADNVRDKVSRNRQAKAEGNGRSKLTKEAVLEIRQLRAKQTRNSVAKLFNVSPKVIYNVWRNRSWGSI